jgi:hypothetical protein
MRNSIRVQVLLVGACLLTCMTAVGQQSTGSEKHDTSSIDAAVVFNPLIANVVGDADNGFWMQGGSIQVHARFWRGLGIVGDVAGMHTASTSGSNVGLDMVTTTFGPRYTWVPARGHYSIFGQALAGEAYGLNSVFPSASGAKDSANSLAVYLGGGVNLHLRGHIGLRLLEADWLRTEMPNSTTNVQNNLRVGAGIVIWLR